MGYVRTAGMSTAARRARRRATLVLAALLMLLVVALLIALAFMRGWFGLGEGDADDASQTTAVAAPPPAMTTDEVTVNVFNSTGRAGLAGRAADALRARGFEVEGVDNTDAVEGAGVVRHGPEGEEQAELLADEVGQGVTLVLDEREGTTVDLVLGPDWEDLSDGEEGTDEGGTGGDDEEDAEDGGDTDG